MDGFCRKNADELGCLRKLDTIELSYLKGIHQSQHSPPFNSEIQDFLTKAIRSRPGDSASAMTLLPAKHVNPPSRGQVSKFLGLALKSQQSAGKKHLDNHTLDPSAHPTTKSK